MWDAVSAFIARVVSRFPGTSITGSLVVCLILAAGLHNVRFEQDIRKSFSPDDSVSGKVADCFKDPERCSPDPGLRSASHVIPPLLGDSDSYYVHSVLNLRKTPAETGE
ncbi:unnamed protein product [Haemonchus placei]|uniref:ABC transporter permease n=1 Tax=Haemonchus placei TaxID=6290 RepID=A0A0N4WK35_HAEPC|nr:unnamed protein product [Haemonchus placei]